MGRGSEADLTLLGLETFRRRALLRGIIFELREENPMKEELPLVDPEKVDATITCGYCVLGFLILLIGRWLLQ